MTQDQLNQAEKLKAIVNECEILDQPLLLAIGILYLRQTGSKSVTRSTFSTTIWM